MRGRPPKHFLLRDDLTECAEHVSSVIRHRPRKNDKYNLYVAADGGIRVIRESDPSQRPGAEMVCVYDGTALVEHIEDDLLDKRRNLIQSMRAIRDKK